MHVYLHSYLYLISVSDLVSIYCYFMTPTTTSRSTAAAIATTTAITILLGHLRHTKSQQSPLPRGGQVLLEGVARPSIAVVVLPLACVEVGFRRIRSHPCEGHRLRSTVVYVPPHSMGSGAGTASKLKRRYTGFSGIPRGIAVPEVGVPAAVLVNAKLSRLSSSTGSTHPPRSLSATLACRHGQRLTQPLRVLLRELLVLRRRTGHKHFVLVQPP